MLSTKTVLLAALAVAMANAHSILISPRPRNAIDTLDERWGSNGTVNLINKLVHFRICTFTFTIDKEVSGVTVLRTSAMLYARKAGPRLLVDAWRSSLAEHCW